ncbi:PREDICTED: protein N-lysine methyltransferase METTL21A isoform X2 [Eurypyga helias]|uniref:protein N-lysine methyltransferase METTL21A isoform X2 n=1 Tax=Eurypyga helias TaxID=54383 RepID=UPI000528CF5C|nr:PREDICTED: protein N-lysine methyltransferase METTL21A isoform X2 [Eurypyga helias]
MGGIDLRERSVIELGAGTGLLGIVATLLEHCILNAVFVEMDCVSETYTLVPLRCPCYHHRQGGSTGVPGVKRTG